MKKNNNMMSFIIVTGIIILIIFSVVLAINILPNHESNSYYVKIEDNLNAKIETVEIKNNNLIINTSGDATEYCVKSTRTTPTINSICWKKIDNNNASISLYKNKKYYVWIKDINENISKPMAVNNNKNES